MTDKSKTEIKVETTATVYGKDTLFLRQAGADATDPATGEKFECSTNIGTGAPIILMPDGRWVCFSWQALIEAARTACKAPT